VTFRRNTHESHLSRFSSCSQLNRNNILQLFHLVLHVSLQSHLLFRLI